MVSDVNLTARDVCRRLFYLARRPPTGGVLTAHTLSGPRVLACTLVLFPGCARDVTAASSICCLGFPTTMGLNVPSDCVQARINPCSVRSILSPDRKGS